VNGKKRVKIRFFQKKDNVIFLGVSGEGCMGIIREKLNQRKGIESL